VAGRPGTPRTGGWFTIGTVGVNLDERQPDGAYVQYGTGMVRVTFTLGPDDFRDVPDLALYAAG
jgi:hypothetical protein